MLTCLLEAVLALFPILPYSPISSILLSQLYNASSSNIKKLYTIEIHDATAIYAFWNNPLFFSSILDGLNIFITA